MMCVNASKINPIHFKKKNKTYYTNLKKWLDKKYHTPCSPSLFLVVSWEYFYFLNFFLLIIIWNATKKLTPSHIEI